MINLKIKTEYTFRNRYGRIKDIIKHVGNVRALAITDEQSTWGHSEFVDSCRKAGIKPILGVCLNIVLSLESERKQDSWQVTLLARNLEGLKEIYRINSKSYDQLYYKPRTTIDEINNLSRNIIVLLGSNPHPLLKPKHAIFYYEFNPGFARYNQILKKEAKDNCVVTSDNYYPSKSDKSAYEAISEFTDKKLSPQHILTEQEMLAIGFPQDAIDNTDVIADLCEEYDMQHSEMVHFTDQPTLLELCKQGAKFRNFKLTKERMQRLNRELELIKQKEYEDYFYLVGDLTRWAKEHMFVGPARGSAAGSLVCFLLRITEVEPIEHGLLFERFIDITRNDLPDIDIDFPDDKRQMVIDYLEQKYGKDKITHIGTVSRYKAKSAIGEVAKKYNIPLSDTEDIKGAIIERSSGDARAQFCIADTFESLQIGKDFLEKYPCMSVVSQVEGHARHSGCHAAGIIVAKTDIQDVCSVNMRYNIAQVDKYTAEKLNLLKIDVLGLRTLSVLNSCLESLGKTPEFLYALDLNDRKAFDIINNGRFSGIFQFEGFSLTSLCKQMIIEEFSDVVALTSLARPGPLNCGGATMFLSRRTGLSEVKYDNEFLKEATEETQGVIVYQEQIMQISKNLGKMSWEDISIIRKAMSKSLGEEFFNRYYEKFRIGAEENGVAEADARRIWDTMCTFGSYAFNKSHAVSYAMISYYCMYLKAHYPLQFAVACLNNEKDSESTIKLLRDLVKEGYEYKPFDIDHSQATWSIYNGTLMGGFIGIKGFGEAKAKDAIIKRERGIPWTKSIKEKLLNPETPYDDIFEIANKFKDYYQHPEKYNITSQPICTIEDIKDDGTYVFIAKLKTKNLRDLNEYIFVQKRGGTLVDHHVNLLNLTFEDDSDIIKARIDRFQYDRLGKDIIESGKIGDFYLVKGKISRGYRMVYVSNIKRIEPPRGK